MTNEEMIRIIGTSVGTSIIYGIRCSLAARKERRQAPSYDPRTETGYKIAHRLGKLWARCKQLRR